MSRGSRDDCQEKLDRYNTARDEYTTYMDDIAVYQASYDLRVAQMINEDIPAKNEKVEIRQGKLYEISALLDGSNKNEALTAPDRIDEIDQRLEKINERLNKIMGMLDGSAGPSEVQALFGEGDNLAAERDGLLNERHGLVALIQRYNEVVEQVEQLDQEIKMLEAEIAQMENNIDITESEAAADRNYVETAESHASNRRYLMSEIQALWDDFECSEYFGELPGFDEVPAINEEDIPEDEEPVDTGDYEVPEPIDEPGEPEENEDWNPDGYDDPAATG